MNCPYCNHPVMNHPDEKRTYCTDCWEALLQDENDLHCTHKRYNLELSAWKAEAMAARDYIDNFLTPNLGWGLDADNKEENENKYLAARVPDETEEPT